MKFFSFQFHITDACDQRCKHCYIFSENSAKRIDSVDKDDMDIVLSKCIAFCNHFSRTPYFYITGGDPILNDDFLYLLKKLKEHNIRFSILGNPFHLDEKIAETMKSFGLEKYQMSLDGSRETHDWFRKQGSYEMTFSKIPVLRRYGITSVIMTTVSEKNISEIPALIDDVVKNRVDVYSFARYCPTSQEKNVNITPRQYREFLDICYNKFQEYKDSNTHFDMKDHLWTLYLYEKGIFKIPNDSVAGMIYEGCNLGNCHISILSNGDIYACRRFNSLVGNIFKDDLVEIWLGKMEEYRQYDKFSKCSKCELLPFCRGCPAVAYSKNQNPYDEDPQCWKVIE